MENRKELLEQYMEDGKLPLKGELFVRKSVVGGKLEEFREKKRADALTSRQNTVGGQKWILRRSNRVYWGIAAMFIVLLGIGGYYFSEEKLVTETTAMDYELPDGSKVKLMGNSSLSYNRVTWFWERKLQLLGKALFKVTPGKTFTVQTEAGDVSVLGTKFLVVQQGKKMLVNCEEGSVKVATPVGQRTLTAGQSVRCDETKIVPVERKVPTPEAEYPEVLGYEDDPLINVVADIEQIFKLTVIGHEKCEGLTYSGTVLTRDLNATLENVFGSSGIGYQLREKEIILE